MPEYKSVRLELRVYEELLQQMRPRESLSQIIERVLNERDEIAGHAQAIVQIKGGDKHD